MRVITVVAAGLIALLQAAADPKFEVASVRISPSTLGTATLNGSTTLWSPAFTLNGTVTVRNATMRQLIQLAYKDVLAADFLVGGPNWLDSDRFDVVAKALPQTPIDTQRQMLQAVLAERFSLRIHREPRSVNVWTLVVAKDGPKLNPTKVTGGDPGGCPRSQTSPDGMVHKPCENVTMPVLAEQLSTFAPLYVDRPVVDRTGVTGAYDFQLDWQPRPPLDGVASGTTIFQALEKQLGLRLEERKVEMPVLVVDQVNRIPTEN